MNFKRISASCFCLLLAGNIAVSAQTVTLGSNKVSLKAAFEKIEKASKYKIAYNSSTINANRMVTISKTKGDVLEILNLLLKECGCTYEEKGQLYYCEASVEETIQRAECEACDGSAY